MGLLALSCTGDDAIAMRSVSSNSGNVKSSLRSASFNGLDSEPFGSSKLIVKGSLSFKGEKNDPFQLETKISMKSSWIYLSKKMTMESPIVRTSSPKNAAAVKLQKVYKSFRTRRQLADCAVLVEQRWWELLDFALLERSSVSFFDIEEPESAVSRWLRARRRAATVGKGLSKDEKAQKLALQHWLEAIDPRHRYGHNLHFYYNCWLCCESEQPFFYWLDVGEGKEVNLEAQCPRLKLQQQCIKYLGPKERAEYEVVVEDGKFLYKRSGELLDTSEGSKDSKWIFVLSTSKTLYVGQKKKGTFQHSSFLAGGATSAAGRLVVVKGILKAVWPHSGHYRPTKENFQEFMSFLKEKNVDLTDVKQNPTEDDEDSFSLRRFHSELDLTQEDLWADVPKSSSAFNLLVGNISFHSSSTEFQSGSEGRAPKRLLNLEQCHEANKKIKIENPEEVSVPQESILRRINSKKGMKSYQLGKQLSCKWTTGAGPRIGCVRDYPSELQALAFEQVNLSPRDDGSSKPYASPRNMPIQISIMQQIPPLDVPILQKPNIHRYKKSACLNLV